MKFKPEDFEDVLEHYHSRIFADCANMANRKLAAWLESAPVIYLASDTLESSTYITTTEACGFEFTAQIVGLKSRVCKHEPVPLSNSLVSGYISTKPFCKHCGVELTATWTAKV